MEVQENHHCSGTKMGQPLGQIVSDERVWSVLKGSSVCRIIKLSCRFGIDVFQHWKEQLALVQGLLVSFPTPQTWTDPENQPPSFPLAPRLLQLHTAVFRGNLDVLCYCDIIGLKTRASVPSCSLSLEGMSVWMPVLAGEERAWGDSAWERHSNLASSWGALQALAGEVFMTKSLLCGVARLPQLSQRGRQSPHLVWRGAEVWKSTLRMWRKRVRWQKEGQLWKWDLRSSFEQSSECIWCFGLAA